MISRQKLPLQSELKKLFKYNKKGFFIRKVKTGYLTHVGQVVGAVKRSDGYCQMRVNNEKFLVHRLVFLFHKGFCPEHVDHKNRKPFDNRIENLRCATHSENIVNQKMHPSNKSGVRGVYFCNTHKMWKCQIGYGAGKRYSFSSKTKKECCKKCRQKQNELWGKNVRT